jgi:hypothetical protein
MPNYAICLLGQVLGGRKAREEWTTHLREELDGFRDQYNLINYAYIAGFSKDTIGNHEV